MGGVGRRVTLWAVTWVAVAAALRLVVVAPERCPEITVADAERTVVEAVGWFERNQRPDGTWLYRDDAAADEDLGGYNVVRHAGVTMSLYQAHAGGVPGALGVADAGAAWALDHLIRHDDWAAFAPSRRVTTGATALLVAGLVDRREATGDPVHDDVLGELGRFLVAQVEPSGAVLAEWDAERREPRPGVYSPFFTGEAWWALALLHRAFPDDGWDEPARRIGRYVATERDEVEGYQPDISDHWAAYALSVTTTWPGAHPDRPLSAAEADYAERQAAFAGIQVRWESQRTDEWPNWWLRGRQTLGAGLGTLGEQLDGLWRVSLADERLADLADPLAERAVCVAGMLVDRQVDAAEAEATADPGRSRGAWFQFDVTQMDDQQHALSAVLLAIPILEERR
jgi:hypothetical protein